MLDRALTLLLCAPIAYLGSPNAASKALCRTGFLGIDKLLDFGSFLVDFGQMLRTELLIDGEFLLGVILLPDVHVVIAKAIVGIWKVRIQFQGR